MPAKDLSDILAPPEKRSLASDIVGRLREAIYNGHLAPNERLREEALASSLGLSRGPVREALAQLEREGLVIRQPNKSAVVARLSLEDLEEVYSLRQSLEELAVRKAIRNAEDRYFEDMQAVVNTMAAALERGITTQEAARLDIQFHEIIYQASKHKRLINIWATLRPQIHIFLLSRNVVNDDFRPYMIPTHQSLLDAIRDRDEPNAVRMLHEHLQGAYVRVLNSYSRHVANSTDEPTGKESNDAR